MSLYTIEEWRSYQVANSDGLSKIIDLVKTYDPKDPAWITIASKEQLQDQWNAIEGNTVSYIVQDLNLPKS